MTPPAGPNPVAQSQRILAYALTAALVIIGVVLAVVIKPDAGESTKVSPVAVLIAVGLGLIMHLAINATGYRLPPLPADIPTDQAQSLALQRFQLSMFTRFPMAELPGLVAVALAFVWQPPTWLNYVPGAAVAIALMYWHVWPTRRVLERCATALERNGTHSGLVEAFGQ